MKFTTEMDQDFYSWSTAGHPVNKIVGLMNDKYNVKTTLSILQHHKRALRFNGWWDSQTASAKTSTTDIEVRAGQDLTPEMVLEKHGYDPSLWEIVTHSANAWQQRPDATVYQSKLTVKPLVQPTDIAAVAEMLEERVEPTTIETPAPTTGKTNLVIPLADLHFGHTTLDDLSVHLDNLGSTIRRGYDNIVVVVVGDLLHSDVIHGTHTTRGTVLEDVNMKDGIRDADNFLRRIFELSLANANRVSVYSIAGNHDLNLGWLYMRGLAYKYPQIDFHNTDDYRLAFQLGKCGFMVLHGDVALKRAPMLFANEFTDVWATSSNRTIFSGHFHTQKTVDEGGVMLHQLGTPKPNDKYERDNGFTMGGGQFQVFEYGYARLVSTIEV